MDLALYDISIVSYCVSLSLIVFGTVGFHLLPSFELCLRQK